MARSNGIQDRPGGQPGRQPYPSDQVDHGLPWASGPAAPAPFDPHAAGQLPWPQAQQPIGQAYQPQHTAPPAQHYHGQPPFPQGQSGQPQFAQAYVPPQYPQAPTYTPPPDAHQAQYFPQQPAPGHDFAQHPGYQQATFAAQSGYQDPAAQLRGSFAPHETHYTAPPAQHGHDPRQFDLGAYGNPAATYTDPATGRALAPAQLPAAALPVGAQQAPLNKAPAAAAGQAQDDAYDDDEYEDEDEEEAPKKRFGWVKILGVLALAIGIGGGAAYGLKKFGGSVMTASTKPVTVKAETGPTKSKAVAAADSKASERLGADSVPAVVPSGDAQGDQPGSPRKVQTVSITPPATANLRPTVSIPGVTIEGGMALAPSAAPQAQPASQPSNLPPVTQAPAGRAVAPPPAAAQPQRAPVAPKVIAAVEEPAAAAAKAAPAPAARVPVAKPSKQSDAYSPASGVGAATVATATSPPPAAAAPAPARPSGGNGYIAVLTSTSSAIDSRKALDDLQGKYSESIGGKPTDVREFVNPRDGKTYYRAVVGPPGSREAANAVCEQMKNAGHQGCFTAAY